MATLFGTFPFWQKLFADGGYQGPEFGRALARVLPHLKAAIVKRSDRAKGFVVLPKRWVVERTFAWLGLGEPQSKSARIHAPRLNLPHAQKTL